MKVLITGGGTGGHVYPALAIAKGLQNKYEKVELLYVGTEKGFEANIVPKEGIPFETIEVVGLQRKLSLQLFSTGIRVSKGFLKSRKIIENFKPDIVIGTGGYVCGPVVLAAALKKIPTLIHEQNAYPGVTNKLLARFVNKIAVTFPDSIKYFPDKKKIMVTGLPVRPEILSLKKSEGYKVLDLDPNKKTILVVGGSRGARSLNLAMIDVIDELRSNKDIQILHATGQLGYEDILERMRDKGIPVENSGNITVIPYLYDMANALNVADLIICRAGATTLAEITAIGIPSILIPYPYASENHQEHNAMALVNQDAAVLIKDSELSGQVLMEKIKDLLKKDKLDKMAKKSKELGKPEALERILETVENILDKSHSQLSR